MTIHVSGDGFQGYLVVDSIVGETSSGGVRICDDLAPEEIQELAREMSLKYALFRLPRGGAKAGVRLSPGLDREARLRALREFGRKLGPVIRTGIYNPGMDMNCGPDELRAIYHGAGITLGALTDTSWFTALSVFHALEAAIASLSLQERPVRIAIEGFGSVARALARRLPPQIRIVGVATVAGAAILQEGFDPVQLAERSQQEGDAFVSALSGAVQDRREFLSCDADVLLPAARTRSLTLDVVPYLRVAAIVPIANAPYAEGVVDALHARGVVCLPGYVVNMGGVFASSLHDQGVEGAAVEDLFAMEYRQAVADLIRVARKRGVAASVLAENLASQRILERTRFEPRSLPRRVYDRFLRRRLPRAIRSAQAGRLARQALDSLRHDLQRAEQAS